MKIGILVIGLLAGWNVAQTCPENQQVTDSLYQQAQKIYAAQQWSQAVAQLDSICPCLPVQTQIPCQTWSIRALAELGTTDSMSLQTTLMRLDTLMLRIEPEHPWFADIMLLQSAVYLQNHEPLKAWKTWRLAKQVALTSGQISLLKSLCLEVENQIQDSSLTGHDCEKLPPLRKQLTQASVAANDTSASSQGTWILQFGAFGNRNNAQLMLQNLTRRKIPSRIVQKMTAERTLYLVQTEPFKDRQSAEDYGRQKLAPLKLEYQPLPAP